MTVEILKYPAEEIAHRVLSIERLMPSGQNPRLRKDLSSFLSKTFVFQLFLTRACVQLAGGFRRGDPSGSSPIGICKAEDHAVVRSHGGFNEQDSPPP